MKTIIAGSRTFSDYGKASNILDRSTITEVISGMAVGADQIGIRYALEHKLPLSKFPAEWNKFGKSAGYKRNEQMAEKAEALIAFWDGESKGTKHMIDIATKKQLKITVVYI